MKSVYINNYGDENALIVGDRPVPAIKDDEVLIRVKAAGVNPIDWKIRDGYLKRFIQYSFPLILGWDVSGVVGALGKDVKRFRKGDEVYAYTDVSRNGTYAEYTAVPSAFVAKKPTSLNHQQAAGVPIAALTAWQALFETAKLSQGQSVFIHGAAGGVGSFAVQLAKWKGAHVTVSAFLENKDFLMELGADVFVDAKKNDFDKANETFDVVLDTLGGGWQDRSWSILKRSGFLVSVFSPPSKEKAEALQAGSAFVSTQTSASQLTAIAGLIDQEKIKPVIHTVLPLDEAKKAHQMSQKGILRGKIVFTV